MPFKKQSLDDDNYQAYQEYKNAEPVDAVHIFKPLTLWRVGIALLYVQIFRKLLPDAHKLILVLDET